MAQLVLDVPDALLPDFRAMAGEKGFPATNGGAKQMAAAELRRMFKEWRALQARRSVAATLDEATAQADTDAGGIV